MSNLRTRLERIEDTLITQQLLTVYVWGDGDADAAIAAARANKTWPDDGKHPVTVTRVSDG